MYQKYCQLEIDGRWIGLEKTDLITEYFCTPVDADIIGWENNIHYCFIRGNRDMVFAVNPEPVVEQYVYPLAMNFKDFLRLILACGSTTAVEQIIGWSREQFEQFVVSEDHAIHPEQQKVLDVIRTSLKSKPMEDPYAYVRSVQEQFDQYHREMKFSNAYYDTLGLERPDGSDGEAELLEFAPVTFVFVTKKK